MTDSVLSKLSNGDEPESWNLIVYSCFLEALDSDTLLLTCMAFSKKADSKYMILPLSFSKVIFKKMFLYLPPNMRCEQTLFSLNFCCYHSFCLFAGGIIL